MLHINDLTLRIEGRVLIDQATVAIPDGHVVGFVGRNGAGKSTLVRAILGDLSPETGTISWPKGRRIGTLPQEAPGGPESLIDTVLAADEERTALLVEAETAQDPMRIAEIQTRLADMNAHAAPARAAKILAGLGFPEEHQSRPCSDYSGGWRMRVALAAVLFAEPDILLLDEPTNYLDLEGTIWLENFLKSYPYTALVISHDRDLLNTIARGIVHLERGKLNFYAGNFDTFERVRKEKMELALANKSKQDAARKHLQAYVDRFRYKADKARQAQSRLKMIARLTPVDLVTDDPVLPFNFPNPTQMSPPIIRMEDVEIGYTEKPILRDITLRIDDDDRIALLGANGNGKSTFAKLLSDRLKPMAGKKFAHKKLKIGYFAQHQLDELNPKSSAYDHVRELLPDATEAQVRARVGAIGFPGQKADTPAEKLSGGEKARLALALATFDAPHLFILDEPTNHLDMDSRTALIEALTNYEGAVILISHDRYLVETVADRLWIVRDGTVTPYEGDMDEYRQSLLDASSGGAKHGSDEQKGVSRQEQRRLAAQARAEIAPLKRTADKAEARVHKLEEELRKMDDELADPKLFEGDGAKGAELAKKRGLKAKDLQQAEEDWMEALEVYEAAQAELA